MTCVQTLDCVIDVYCQYRQCSALYLLTFFFFSCPVGRVLQSGAPQRGGPIVSSQISATPLSETADQVSGQFKSCTLPSLRCVPLQSRAEVLMTVVKTPSIHGEAGSGLLAVQTSTEDGCMEYASQSCSEGDVYQEMAPNTFTEPKALSNRSRYRPAQAGHFPR